MKICVISCDFSFEPLGGRNVALKRIMQGICEKFPETEFHVITEKGRMGFEKRDGIFSYRLGRLEKNARGMVKRLDKKMDFDIIHGFDIHPDGHLAASIASLLKKPCIVGLRGVYILKAGALVMKYVAKKANYIVAVDHKSMELFKRVTKRKKNVISIRNAIKPFKVQKKRKSKHFIIGNVTYLGDIRKTKGWDYLLDAFRKIRKDMPDSRLVLIGASDTSKTSKIRELLKYKGIEKDVVLKGVMKHENVLKAMQDFDVYVSPSTFDGMPNAVLEVMTLKKPVIATNSGGVPEIIRNGYNGLIVNEFSPDEIHEKMLSLHRNAGERKRIGLNAFNTIKREFDPERETEKWYKLYKKLAGL